MHRVILDLWEGFLDLLYPEGIKCYMCGSKIVGVHRYGVCSGCIKEFVFIGNKSCICCGKLLETGDLCNDCRSFLHFFDRAFSLCLYDGAVKEWIYSFKYGNKPYLARPFARMMADRIKELGLDECIDTVIPVPLHRKKLRQRGYNQSRLLGHVVAREIDKRLAEVIVRGKNTPPLSGLTRLERIQCLEGAFEIKPDKMHKGIKNVMLIDDIYTTGTTVNECARLLKDAGCERVFVFTVASGKNP